MARYRSSTDATARLIAVAFVATLWLGLLIGVSFLATPVKFLAPSLTLPTALEVGRATFALLVRVEWGLTALLFLAVAWAGRAGGQRGLWLCFILIGLTLAAESLWLLPILDERVSRIVAGEAPDPSWHHRLYVALEAAKVVILLVMAGRSFLMLSQGLRSFRSAEVAGLNLPLKALL